ISTRRTAWPRAASWWAASQPARPPPTMVTIGFKDPQGYQPGPGRASRSVRVRQPALAPGSSRPAVVTLTHRGQDEEAAMDREFLEEMRVRLLERRHALVR